MKTKIIKNTHILNTVSSLTLQASLIISNLIIPKIILSTFGSETNGLITSLSQLLNYITLAEGGIGGVLMASLYTPLYKKNTAKISAIIKTASSFYKKISGFFILYVLALMVIYPIVTDTSFSSSFIIGMIIVLSISTIITYAFSLSLRSLLVADKKSYIPFFTQAAITILTTVLTAILAKLFPNILIIKFASSALYVIQPIVFNIYVKKYYNLDKKCMEDKKLLKSRWDGFAVNIAFFVHGFTDTVILTLFSDLKTVSVYSIYSIVTLGLRNIIQSLSSLLTPIIGQSVASKDAKNINSSFNLSELIQFILIFPAFSVASLLVRPFILFYTSNITDVNYDQPIFAILLIISEIMFLIKDPHVALAYSKNQFKTMTIPCFIEAGINICLSIILVKPLRIIGVTIGTIVAMTYRYIYHLRLTKKLIGRGYGYSIKNALYFLLSASVTIILCLTIIPRAECNLISIIIHGILYLLVSGIVTLLLLILRYKTETKTIINKFLKKSTDSSASNHD